MATFYTAAQAAIKAGFTHLESGSGEKKPLSLITPKMKPSPFAGRNGWRFDTVNFPDPVLFHVVRRNGFESGYYKLVKEGK
jgi:hypothetical protein